MFSAELASRIAAAPWFQVKWTPYLAVDADYRICAVNPAYEEATAASRSALIGARLFDAFPDNPGDPAADGVANLTLSLESVFRRGARHWMGVQRYDIPDRREPGQFIYKVWAPVNTPIREGGKTVAVLHHVQDVSVVFGPASGPGPAMTLGDLQDAAEVLCREFPELPGEAVTGILAESHRTVIGASGFLDSARSAALARIRMQVRAGRSPLAQDDPRQSDADIRRELPQSPLGRLKGSAPND